MQHRQQLGSRTAPLDPGSTDVSAAGTRSCPCLMAARCRSHPAVATTLAQGCGRLPYPPTRGPRRSGDECCLGRSSPFRVADGPGGSGPPGDGAFPQARVPVRPRLRLFGARSGLHVLAQVLYTGINLPPAAHRSRRTADCVWRTAGRERRAAGCGAKPATERGQLGNPEPRPGRAHRGRFQSRRLISPRAR